MGLTFLSTAHNERASWIPDRSDVRWVSLEDESGLTEPSLSPWLGAGVEYREISGVRRPLGSRQAFKSTAASTRPLRR